jgi:hypothetical protein
MAPSDRPASKIPPATGVWSLWTPEEVLKKITGFDPLLALWEKASNPAQQRLEAYLAWLASELGPLPPEPQPLFLHLEIDVHEPGRLTHHHDLENYLTPLFGSRYLDPRRFLLVSGHKKVDDGSHLVIGRVREMTKETLGEGWGHFSYHANNARLWKPNLRSSLATSNLEPLPPGPVEVILAWCCSPRRNWVNPLWKETGDAMGPILGEPSPTKPYSPKDDRIVRLAFHRNPDADRRNALDVAIWWRVLRESQTQ